jgi:hypothetical protein
MGFHLTYSKKSLHDYKDVIAKQGVPLLPSGQKVPMYPGSNFTYPEQLKKLKEWSKETFHPRMLTERVRKSKDQDEPESHTLVYQHCPSLEDLKIGNVYGAYESYEIDILRPKRIWRLPIPMHDGTLSNYCNNLSL